MEYNGRKDSIGCKAGLEDTDDSYDADNVLAEFEKILDKATEVAFDVPEKASAFKTKFGARLEAKDKTHGSLLHVFVDNNKGEPTPFAKWLIKNYPQLLEFTDYEHKTPLHLAMSNRKKWPGFVELVLEHSPKDILAKALEIQDTSGRNCLYLAISTRLRSTLKLIDKCSARTFMDRSNGDTALHLAMTTDHSSNTRPPPKSQSSLPRKSTNLPPNRTPHDKSELQEQSKFEETKAEESKNKDKTPVGTKNESYPKETVKIDQTSIKKSKGPVNPPHIRSHEPRDTSDPPSIQPEFFLPDVVQSLYEHNEESMLVRNLKNWTPYQDRLYWLTEKRRRWTVTTDIIAPGMKEYCLRNVEREKAIDILYENGREKHIEFDLSSLPSSSISRADLDRLSRHLTFEDTLKYVALPKLRVEDPNIMNTTATPAALSTTSTSIIARQDKYSSKPFADTQELPVPDRVGLTDATVIFKWLSENNVGRIFKIIVIDDGEIPHSDQAIEEALKPFEVEIWDWKKIDICSETIFRAAEKSLREVYLYASGNPAVLKGWSCMGGLVKLEKLEKVYLIVRRGFETEERRNRDFRDFEKDFKSNWAAKYNRQPPLVKWIGDDKSESYASVFQTNKAPDQKENWLVHMDIFASFISDVNMKQEQQGRTQALAEAKDKGFDHLPKLLEDIKVAVIDDGIDGFQGDLIENIASGVSFCKSSDAGNLMRAYYVPSGGHGTIMARLICRICPKVKLYIARLEEFKAPNEKRLITAQSATKAVRWAITKGVQIISMSWTIEGNAEQEDIRALGEAIKDAHKAHIIMLCSFSDQGNNSPDNTFPCKWDEYCWTIGAATARGNASTLVDETKVAFLFPGEQIVISPKSSSASLTARAEKGSSISTALAAGTVALLLFITQLVNPEFYEQLREPRRMKDALLRFCPGGNNHPYFNAQEHFDKRFADTEWKWATETGKNQAKILARSLMTFSEQQEQVI